MELQSSGLGFVLISFRVGHGGGEGGGKWYTSIPEKNSPKYPKIPTIHPNIPKIKVGIFIPEIQRK